jgi:hypothetical protein
LPVDNHDNTEPCHVCRSTTMTMPSLCHVCRSTTMTVADLVLPGKCSLMTGAAPVLADEHPLTTEGSGGAAAPAGAVVRAHLALGHVDW